MRRGELGLEYISFGAGPKVLLAFHGFGRRAEDVLFFREELEKKYTVYSFNFFHHGKSEYPEQRIHSNTLHPEELCEMFKQFFDEKQISSFSLLGYSMGGKISLQLLHFFPEMVDSIFLLAPDGLKHNFWYDFTSRNKVGTSLYRRLKKKPDRFFSVLKFLQRSGLLKEKLYRFVMGNLDTPQKREMVYKVWMTMRLIRPSISESARLIKKLNIPAYLLFGKHDKVIPLKIGHRFNKKAGTTCLVIGVDCGHNMYTEQTKEKLQAIL